MYFWCYSVIRNGGGYVASFMDIKTYTGFILYGVILFWFHIYEYDLVERE